MTRESFQLGWKVGLALRLAICFFWIRACDNKPEDPPLCEESASADEAPDDGPAGAPFESPLLRIVSAWLDDEGPTGPATPVAEDAVPSTGSMSLESSVSSPLFFGVLAWATAAGELPGRCGPAAACCCARMAGGSTLASAYSELILDAR